MTLLELNTERDTIEKEIVDWKEIALNGEEYHARNHALKKLDELNQRLGEIKKEIADLIPKEDAKN